MSEQSPQVTRSGPPSWTYALGAIVGAVGVAWTVASHFIPKVEGAKAAPLAAMPAVMQQATATGGTAVNASDGARVTVGSAAGAGPGVAASNARAAFDQPVGQTAQAGSGGTAINASGGAQVQVDKH